MQTIYKLIAKHITSDKSRVDRLIHYARRHPYSHLGDYMGRWWVFNPYHDEEGNDIERNWLMRNVLPSLRIHHIRRPDADRHLHNHPWNAQRIVLRGWYTEVCDSFFPQNAGDPLEAVTLTCQRTLKAGDTAPLRCGEFHRVAEVSEGGCWTLFITGRKRGSWGFKLDDGTFVHWREYLANPRM